jgi:hypothetical protein
VSLKNDFIFIDRDKGEAKQALSLREEIYMDLFIRSGGGFLPFLRPPNSFLSSPRLEATDR